MTGEKETVGEHRMKVESTQVWRGEVEPENAELLTGDGNRTNIMGQKIGNTFSLELHEETKLIFECTCGRRFRKPKTAREHLEEESHG